MLSACLLTLAAPAAALAQDPVRWSAKANPDGLQPGGSFNVTVSATIDEEWYVYSVTQGPGGPVPTSLAIGPRALFSRSGAIKGPQPVSAFDPNFEIRTEKYDSALTLTFPVTLAANAAGTRATLSVAVTYQACTSRLCLPPTTETLKVPIAWTASGSPLPASGFPIPDPPTPIPDPPAPEPASFGTAGASSWSAFIWLALTMGVLSLLTPCVFPMVPITVSYFTNHAAPTRARAVGSALLYGLGIVLTFTVLGSALAAVAGAAGLTRFAANPWVNLGITALFVLFALNLFGVFEIALPSRLLTRIAGLSRRRGSSIAGTLLMAGTFTVTSLTCTAAFLGTLLVVAAQGEWQRPVVGLLAYSTAFALPFVALAAAPQFVSQLPRSGPWLGRVKVVMGFLEIAAAMKFLSNADLVWSWGIFTRGVVLVAWTVTAVVLAAYLIGKRPGVGRLTAALATLAFAVWLASGVTGRRLGELEAFLPPFDYAQGRPGSVHAASRGELSWITDDLDAAIAEARTANRRVIIDFTGYTCTNCRWMEANMFPRPEVRQRLNTFVRARLYTDGQGEIYERQQRYQQERFKTVALPLYAILAPDGRTLATFAGLTRDPAEFLRFLDAGQ